MKATLFHKILFFLLFLLLGGGVKGQVDLVRWNNTNYTPTLVGSNITASNITAVGGVSLGHEAWGDDNNFFLTGNGGSWASGGLDASKYMEFTISPNTGYKIDLDKFNFYYRAGWTPLTFQVRYSKDNFATYSTSIGSTNASEGGWTSASANITAANPVMPGQTLKIRIYAFNTGATFHIKRLFNNGSPTNYSQTPTITGTVSPAVTGDPTDLGITKTMDNLTPSTGNNVVFTIGVNNLGPNTASGASVVDQLPPGFSYVSATPSVGSYNNATGIWTIGNLANSATATLQIVAQMQSTGPYTNTATVSHYGTDPVSANNSENVTPSNACGPCTHALPNGGGHVVVNSGDIYCLHSGTFTGTVTLNTGGIICIASGANFNPLGGSNVYYGTIVNRGNMNFPIYDNATHTAVVENYGVFNTSTIQNFAGTIVNRGTITNTGGTQFLSGASMNNSGAYTSTSFQNFSGTLNNSGSFTITNNMSFLSGAAVINHGNMNLTNLTSSNTSFTNHSSFTVNGGFTLLDNGSFENLISSTARFNMTTGATQIRGQFDNSGVVEMKNANSGQGISGVVNNYNVMKIYDNVILGVETYLTNDNLLEFINIASVEFQGPMLQNNGRLVITAGNLSLHSSISQMVNNGIAIVSGKVSHAVAGSKMTNNCRILANEYFVGNGETINNGLIWVTDYFQIDGTPSLLYQSQTGFIRGVRFRNSGAITGYGRYYFTGNTNFESAGTIVGNSNSEPIQFYDVSQTGNQIFDVFVVDNPAINLIRPISMTPLDTTSFDCSVIPPSVAGYPPYTTAFTEQLCEHHLVPWAPWVREFSLHSPNVTPHSNVNGLPFTVQYNTVRLFEYNNNSNTTNNTTNLTIPGKGIFAYDVPTRTITFTADPAFTTGTVEAEYRISNTWSGLPSTHPSARTRITITIQNCTGTPRKVISNPMLRNRARTN